MLNLAFLFCIIFFNACASRTSVENTNKNIQTLMTLSTNKVAEALLNDPNDKNKTVVVSINGEVIVAPTCSIVGNHAVEVKRSLSDSKPTLWTIVQRSSPMTYTIDQKIEPGEYIIYLLRTRDNHVIQTKNIRININNDRHVINFDGCP